MPGPELKVAFYSRGCTLPESSMAEPFVAKGSLVGRSPCLHVG